MNRTNIDELLRNQMSFLSRIDEKTKESLAWYTGGNFDDFNTSLRKNKPLTTEQQHRLRDIDRLFTQIPATQYPITVYKGKNTKNVYEIDKAFMSTSEDYKSAKQFSGKDCCILQINVSAGSKVIPIKGISREPDEKEILLDRGGQMLVTGSEIRGNMMVIFTTYNPKHSFTINDEKYITQTKKRFNTNAIIDSIVTMFNSTDISDSDSDSDSDIDFSLDFDENLAKKMYKDLTGQEITKDILETIRRRVK